MIQPRKDLVALVRIPAKVLNEDTVCVIRRRLRLDLAGVEMATAGGLGQLIVLHKELQEGGGGLSLCNVEHRVYEVLEATRLTDVLDVRPKGAS